MTEKIYLETLKSVLGRLILHYSPSGIKQILTVEPGVIRVINANKNTIESFSELADEGFYYFRSNITTSWDSYLQQKSDDINSELLGRDSNKEEQLNNFIKDDSVSKHTFTSPETITVLSDNDVGEKIRSLNLKQKEIFD